MYVVMLSKSCTLAVYSMFTLSLSAKEYYYFVTNAGSLMSRKAGLQLQHFVAVECCH